MLGVLDRDNQQRSNITSSNNNNLMKGGININLVKENGYIKIHRHKTNDYSIGSIHSSNNYGLFKIESISDIRGSNGAKLYNVRFLDSDILVTNVRKDHIKDGSIKTFTWKDMIGKEFDTKKSGRFKVIGIDEQNSKNVKYKIYFYNTHNAYSVWRDSILKLEVRDPLAPYNYGVGYLGNEYKNCVNDDKKLCAVLKKKWSCMINRCYNPNKDTWKYYGGIGIKVDDRWLNFSNYYNDVKQLPGFNREDVISGKLQLDKDYLQMSKQPSQKIYSKNTCVWLTTKENLSLIKRCYNERSTTILK